MFSFKGQSFLQGKAFWNSTEDNLKGTCYLTDFRGARSQGTDATPGPEHRLTAQPQEACPFLLTALAPPLPPKAGAQLRVSSISFQENGIWRDDGHAGNVTRHFPVSYLIPFPLCYSPILSFVVCHAVLSLSGVPVERLRNACWHWFRHYLALSGEQGIIHEQSGRASGSILSSTRIKEDAAWRTGGEQISRSRHL